MELTFNVPSVNGDRNVPGGRLPQAAAAPWHGRWGDAVRLPVGGDLEAGSR
jgi:hypothetical protein